MQFDSIDFLFFLPIVLALFGLLKASYRPALLLISSYIFYMHWNVGYSLLLLFSTLVDYFLAFKISSSQKTQRKIYLVLSLFSNLGLLAIFKYNGFITQVLTDLNLSSGDNAFASLLLPVGISFYTFQTMSYAIDVYRGEQEPERNFIRFALYVSFFPQLVAGPIERASRILPQLSEKLSLNENNLKLGFRYILWGFFQKMVVADNLALLSDSVFDQSSSLQGFPLWLGLFAFCFQIYFDFSAYTNIAIGCGRLFGIRLMQNFNRPYLAGNLVEFWRRWHISLSTWFRDYLYIPLGGSQKGFKIQMLAMLVVFVLSGLWHGARYNFLAWGFMHGLGLLVYLSYRKLKPAQLCIPKPVAWAFSFSFVLLSWVLFRSENMSEALVFIKGLSGISLTQLTSFQDFGSLSFLLLALFISGIESQDQFYPFPEKIGKLAVGLRWGFYYTILIAIAVFGVFKSQTFIYFQF